MTHDMKDELGPLVEKVLQHFNTIGVRGRTATAQSEVRGFPDHDPKPTASSPIWDYSTPASIGDELLAAEVPMRSHTRGWRACGGAVQEPAERQDGFVVTKLRQVIECPRSDQHDDCEESDDDWCGAGAGP
jgi:hypothetical protein